ncbi:MAG: hypothetical protein LBI26_00185 [Holosporales bacterium]|jgi:hypothetical protein|nr:hypothetical protein [Holosporales bacterium]
MNKLTYKVLIILGFLGTNNSISAEILDPRGEREEIPTSSAELSRNSESIREDSIIYSILEAEKRIQKINDLPTEEEKISAILDLPPEEKKHAEFHYIKTGMIPPFLPFSDTDDNSLFRPDTKLLAPPSVDVRERCKQANERFRKINDLPTKDEKIFAILDLPPEEKKHAEFYYRNIGMIPPFLLFSNIDDTSLFCPDTELLASPSVDVRERCKQTNERFRKINDLPTEEEKISAILNLPTEEEKKHAIFYCIEAETIPPILCFSDTFDADIETSTIPSLLYSSSIYNRNTFSQVVTEPLDLSTLKGFDSSKTNYYKWCEKVNKKIQEINSLPEGEEKKNAFLVLPQNVKMRSMYYYENKKNIPFLPLPNLLS